MAYADYLHCPGCDGKALYFPDEEPDDIVVWHQSCLTKITNGQLSPLTAEGLDNPTPRMLRQQREIL